MWLLGCLTQLASCVDGTRARVKSEVDTVGVPQKPFSSDCLEALMKSSNVLKTASISCSSDAVYAEVMTYAVKMGLAEAFKNKVNSR